MKHVNLLEIKVLVLILVMCKLLHVHKEILGMCFVESILKIARWFMRLIRSNSDSLDWDTALKDCGNYA